MDAVYSDIFKHPSLHPSSVILTQLNEDLVSLRAASTVYQQTLIADRAKGQAPPNSFQLDDYVTFDAGPKPIPKMSSRLKGPYRVECQRKNDVQVRDLVTDAIHEFSVTDLEPFFGTEHAALEAARSDSEQHEVEVVLSHCGNHDQRTNLEFTLKFRDGTISEVVYTPDIRCEAFFDYCCSPLRRYLFHLQYDAKYAKSFISDKNKLDITKVQPGDVAYVNLQVFGGRFYQSLDLPEWRTMHYVVEFHYTHWYHDTAYSRTQRPNPNYRGKRNKISGTYRHGIGSDFFSTYKTWCFGEDLVFDPVTMILVDATLVAKYPHILS
jgi:hypothetical protein